MAVNSLAGADLTLDTSPVVSDEVKTSTCYMCACRCGIKVHLRDGRIRYIEGNREHPVNKGVLCAKGAAGIMTQYSPARLTKPLKRVGPRGAGGFREIEWAEALQLATSWLDDIRRSTPAELAFYTGRDQSQALTGWWASQFGTPNYAAHGGFCSVNMAAAGLYSIGSSFWEFGEPDWEHTRYFMMFGVAEDHSSNPLKIALGRLKGRPADRRAKFVSVNPIKTGYSAIADEWIAIRPGTDGLFVLAIVHELLHADRIDAEFLVRYTNAPWLVVQDAGWATDGLFARDERGEPVCWDKQRGQFASALRADVKPALAGDFTLPDGRRAVPAFQLMAGRYLDAVYSPDNVAPWCGVPADTIRRIAAELAFAAFEQEIAIDVPWTDWAGRHHERFIGRPVSMHAMRGISAHANGFHTCRAIHMLQMLLGSIDCPGGFRYKPPFPRPVPPGPRPAGRAGDVAPRQPLKGPPLGFPMGPEDLLVDAAGRPERLDKAYSWEAPLAIHGMMHMVIANAWRGDPYPIDTLFLYMSNMSWNSSMNTAGTMQMLADWNHETDEYRIPHIIYADAYYSEMAAFADLVLPDTTYLERHDCISLLDRPISDADGAADAIRQPTVKPDRDVRPFQDVLLDLGSRLRLPGMVKPDGSPRYPGGFADYMVNHERRPGMGLLAGWRGTGGDTIGRGAVNPGQLDRYKDNNCFWRHELADNQKYLRHANRDYLVWAVSMGFIDRPQQVVLQLYSEVMQKFRLAARGHGPHQPPERDRARVDAYFDPLPIWYPPFEESAIDTEDFPLHAVTQRPMAMYHAWGSHNAWLRQIHGRNRLFVNRRTAERLGLADDDWAWVISHHSRVRVQIRLMEGVNEDTVWTWNGIGKRAGAWNLAPDAREATQGFLLNHVIAELLPPQADGYRYANADPITGQAAWYDLRVRIEKAALEEHGETAPTFAKVTVPPGLSHPAAQLKHGASFRGRPDAAPEASAMTSLPSQPTGRKLGLVIDLDTCVGCHACAVNCKEWNSGGHMAPLTDENPYDRDPLGVWFNRVHTYEAGEGADSRTVHFPRSCLHCEQPACVTACPTGASYKRAEDGIVLVNEDLCIGCKLCSWACPYGAREYDYDVGVMKKCTMCIDRIYNENLEEVDRVPACVSTCPVSARHFGDLGDPQSEVSKLVAERGGYELMPEMGYKAVNRYLPPRPRQAAVGDTGAAARLRPADAAPGANPLLRWIDRMLSR